MLRSAGFVRALRLKREEIADFDVYPFSVPTIRSLERLELHPSVTFIIGENGSGKSTLVEGLAVRYGFNAEGGSRSFRFDTRASHSALYSHLVLERSRDIRPTDISCAPRASTMWRPRLKSWMPRAAAARRLAPPTEIAVSTPSPTASHSFRC